jgi:hypothetical protein
LALPSSVRKARFVTPQTHPLFRRFASNEIVVDVGGSCFGWHEPGATAPEKSLIFDHHFTRPNNYPSASAAVLHHAADIVEHLDAYNEIWIVTHQEPDFDALCAVYLVKSLLGGTTGDTNEPPLARLDPAVIAAYGVARDGWTGVPGDGARIRGKINWFRPDIRPSAPGGWFSWWRMRRVCTAASGCMQTLSAPSFGALRRHLAPKVSP